MILGLSTDFSINLVQLLPVVMGCPSTTSLVFLRVPRMSVAAFWGMYWDLMCGEYLAFRRRTTFSTCEAAVAKRCH